MQNSPTGKALRLLLSAFPKAIIGTLILLIIAINFSNTVGRFVFLSPIIWAEEIMVYVMIWITLAGAVLVTWRNRHLRMDIFILLLPKPLRHALNLLAATAFLAVVALILMQSWHVFRLYAHTWQVSVVAKIPMFIPHSAMLFGLGLMLLAVVFRLRMYVRGQYEGDDGKIVEGSTAGPRGPEDPGCADQSESRGEGAGS